MIASEPLIHHRRHGGAGAVEGTVQIDIDDRCPIIVRHLAHGAVAGDSGVIHQDVEPLPLVEYFLDDARGFALLCDIALDQQALAANFGDLRGCTLGMLDLRSEVQRNLGPAARQFKRDRAPNAARSAGNECHAPGERCRLEVSVS